ncbi:hypothetical protein BDQ17DRAFT_1327980 [Cyathus striatus]|nr:hypothetical protein BDQ17DRAFT_1327980 [Cyathus striatus]
MDPNFDIISVASIESDMSCLDHLSDVSNSQGIVKNECVVLDESEKWHSLLSLLPLLQPLPELKEESGYYILDGPITDTNISLLHSHAKHVKFLSNVIETCTEGPKPMLPHKLKVAVSDTKGDYSGLDCEDKPIGISHGSKTLRRLTITAPFQLILHILHRIESDFLYYLHFTFVVNEQYDERDACKRWLKNGGVTETGT